MLIVNNTEFGAADYHATYKQFHEGFKSDRSANQIIAVCLKHPLDIVAAALFLRERECSMLLLNGEIPLITAISFAEKSGCSALYYSEVGNCIPIDGKGYSDVPSILQFSSGTTGEPKLITRSWQQIDLEVTNYNHVIAAEDDEKPIILVPVYHSFGLVAVLSALARDTKPMVITDKNPKFWLHAIDSAPKSIVYGVPFLLHLMLSFRKENFHFHKVISSGSPLTSDLLSKLRLNAQEVLQQYGCSELGCISLGRDIMSPTDVGVPLDHFSIPSLFTKESPGELCVQIGDKIVSTGDIGYVSDSHSIHVLGRMDDQINVSGLKVLPSEVESVIEKLDGVEEVVVFRSKHPIWGESIKAMVVCSTEFTEQDITTWCKKYLPPYKVPRTVEFVTDIARMPSGKISRKLLEEREMK